MVDDELFDRHRSRGAHPERPERLAAAREAVRAARVTTRALATRDATDEELRRVHTAEYLAELAALEGREGHLDADTFIGPDSIAAARRAAGGAVALVEAMLAGDVTRGVGLLRPPGHHATPSRAMGFCLVNNVAVAAAHACALGIARVAIVDWDVHHGNGTQDIFWRDPRVLYVSIHQWPFYPGTGAARERGEGPGLGFSVNVPMSPGAGDAEYGAAFDRVILPVLEQFAPELLLISAGFDAHRSDPLAGMKLEAASYARLAASLVAVAERSAGGRIAAVLEGGYDLQALESSLAATVGALAGRAPAPRSIGAPDPAHEPELERARRAASKYWKV